MRIEQRAADGAHDGNRGVAGGVAARGTRAANGADDAVRSAELRPLVLMIDEIDALVGDTLIAVLRQLRTGYPERPHRFPQSVILCGVRDVRAESLLAQHTRETGQAFTSEARAAGQPWLVNALAYEACFKNRTGRDRSRPVTGDAIHDTREQLILRRETHLDQLADKLREERARRVVEPLLSGAEGADPVAPDDLQYLRDLD